MTLFWLGNKEFKLYFEALINIYFSISFLGRLTPNGEVKISIKYPKIYTYGSEIYSQPWYYDTDPENLF